MSFTVARTNLLLLNVMTVNEASRDTPDIMLCFQIILFLLWFCSIRFVHLSLKITAVFISVFGILANSVGWSHFRTFSYHFDITICTSDFFFNLVSARELLLILFFPHTHTLRMRRFPVIHPRLRRVQPSSSMKCIAHKNV